MEEVSKERQYVYTLSWNGTLCYCTFAPAYNHRGWKISVYLFRRVFRDGAIVERINFRDRIVGNVKKNHAVPSVDKLQLKQKKLHVLRDIQYGPFLFFIIVLYLILKTISLEQLTTERQGYKFLTVYTCITFHFLH
jgi:hypothetical protein